MDLSGMSVAVIGLGVSGVAAARLAAEKGGEVYVSDSRTEDAVATRGADLGDGIEVDLGRHDIERMVDADFVVASPGILPSSPVLQGLKRRGVKWISEPEFASRFLDASLIGITGTNGKTTTTLLVNHLLHASGVTSAAGGNVGGGLAPAASDLARLKERPEWVVLEMSSFQLSGVETFHPDIGVITNLSADHLDRYRSIDEYYSDKSKLFENATEQSVWVFPADDDEVRRLSDGVPGRRYTFGCGTDSSAFLNEGQLILNLEGDIEPVLQRDELPLIGAHNVTNALAAALTARLAGAGSGGVMAGLGSARALPHRLEPVADRAGVLWINDSKATNVAATRSALSSLDRSVILLLGGKDKGEDFAQLAEAMRGRARIVVGYGAAGSRAINELSEALRVGSNEEEESIGGPRASPSFRLVEGSLEDVVVSARNWAESGDVVLLSPACSSFDMYENYEHRGQHFTLLARAEV